MRAFMRRAAMKLPASLRTRNEQPPPFAPLLGPQDSQLLSTSIRSGCLLHMAKRDREPVTRIGLDGRSLLIYRGAWCYPQAFDTALTCMATTSHRDGIIIGGEDGTIRLLNVRTSVYLRLGAPGTPPVTCVVAAAPDKYVCARRDGTLQVWDLAYPGVARAYPALACHAVTGLEQAAEAQILVQRGDIEYELRV
jgi:WD40 repeat protein